MQLLMVIVPQYSPMVRQAQEKHIQWQENNNYLQNKFINLMKEKGLFQGLFSSSGKELKETKIDTL